MNVARSNANATTGSAVEQVAAFVRRCGGRLVVLTGAGVSTASGIPDYRGPKGVYTRHKDYKPIQYQEFMKHHERRQRYWARSYLGWPRVTESRPNAAHLALRQMQKANLLQNGIITQNVDGLHGTENVLEIHGTLHKVQCQNHHCGHTVPRDEFQQQLADLNPAVAEWARRNPDRIDGDVSSSVNPDGDVEVTWDYSEYRYPDCSQCGSIYKPNVVFFGENMPPAVRDESLKRIDTASGLLIVGSSLTVYSAFRLLKRAHESRVPTAALNMGMPRGAELLDFWLDARCDLVLPQVVEALS
ncbi:DHS-like NAD/FAD-binding domain-containing protein [Zopfochytrium polystomum]|nr:DHS-like NAD/FAD-binding domain-containing protein [Zopfochytrium polystomum]